LVDLVVYGDEAIMRVTAIGPSRAAMRTRRTLRGDTGFSLARYSLLIASLLRSDMVVSIAYRG